MSVATEFTSAVFVPARARQLSRDTGSGVSTIPASRPRLRLVPPVEGCPPSPRRRPDGARRGTGLRRRPAACAVLPAPAAAPAGVGIGAGQFKAPPVRLTRRGVLAVALGVALGVALAGGLLLLTAYLSAGTPPARPASAPGTIVTVQPGDTLWSIAGQVAPGRDPRRVVEQLRQSNHLDSVSLTPGQTLKVG
jgi:LysM domain-containing protein